MIPERMQELLILMMLENKCKNNYDLDIWIQSNYNVDNINERYMSFLKEFLTPYALNNTEKSD